jgi:hypothetical protein
VPVAAGAASDVVVICSGVGGYGLNLGLCVHHPPAARNDVIPQR